MRLKSLLATALTGLLCLGFVGCGSSGTGSEFVATSGQQQTGQPGTLVFNFATAQTAFTVDANTTTLLFSFFDGSSSDAIYSQSFAFAPTITVSGVPASASSVVITAFDSNGLPLQTISQSIAVESGQTVTVDGLSAAQTVNLSRLRLAPGNVLEFDSDLTQVLVAAGSTYQVFLFAEYDNGSVVLLGEQASYSIPDAGVATVNAQGTVAGVAAGTTTLTAAFGGQSLPVGVTVTDGEPITFDAISVANPSPINVTVGTPVQLFLSGTVTGTGNFDLPANDPNLTYSLGGTDFSVANGMLSASAPSSDTLTVTYTNPGGSTAQATVSVTSSAAAP